MNDELYHHGVKGMRWGQHIFGKNPDIKRTVAINAKNGIDTINRTISSISFNKKKKKRMNLSNMSDAELRSKINRELLERQYDSVFNPETEAKGSKYVKNVLSVAGGVLGVTGSALGIAVAIQTLKNGKG